MNTEILYVSDLKRRFSVNDYKILSKKFDVDVARYDHMVKDLPKLLVKHATKRYGVVFSWFVWPSSLFTVFRREKKIFVAGGNDIAVVPELNFGEMLNPIKRAIVKMQASPSTLFLSVSKDLDRWLHYWFPHAKSKIIYNGVEDRFYNIQRKHSNTNKKIFITMGGLTSKTEAVRKGVATVVEAAVRFGDILEDNNIKITVLGRRGEGYQWLRKEFGMGLQQVEQRGVIEFCGFVSDEEWINWLSQATGYIQISLYDSFGLACAEAMAAGVPIIHSGRGGLKEVVGSAGLVIPPRRPEKLLSAVIKISEDDELQKELSKKSKKRARKFHLKNRERELVRTVERVLSE